MFDSRPKCSVAPRHLNHGTMSCDGSWGETDLMISMSHGGDNTVSLSSNHSPPSPWHPPIRGQHPSCPASNDTNTGPVSNSPTLALMIRQEDQYRNTVIVILSAILNFLFCAADGRRREVDLDLWPLVTPILGPDLLSQKCKDASREYIQLLSDAFQHPLTLNESHRNALRRLDSGGPFPFLQEGIYMDTKEYNSILSGWES